MNGVDVFGLKWLQARQNRGLTNRGFITAIKGDICTVNWRYDSRMKKNGITFDIHQDKLTSLINVPPNGWERGDPRNEKYPDGCIGLFVVDAVVILKVENAYSRPKQAL